MDSKQKSKTRILVIAILLIILAAGLGFFLKTKLAPAPEVVVEQTTIIEPSAGPSPTDIPQGLPSPGISGQPAGQFDLTVDAQGLSKATAVIRTDKGIIKFKFYTTDAPNTVNRIAELINTGFYNGLTFHRVVPGFVIQGGDPTGTGAGGSGQKLKAEFNNRKHVEGAVAMARAQDPDSADSQFYISLGTHPHLDRQYTIFGQVISGMDVARKITVGDRVQSAVIE